MSTREKLKMEFFISTADVLKFLEEDNKRLANVINKLDKAYEILQELKGMVEKRCCADCDTPLDCGRLCNVCCESFSRRDWNVEPIRVLPKVPPEILQRPPWAG
jgi:hypothetical protein